MNPAKSKPWGDTLEEPNVNRPFYAFGALLAALALAMLAVSSTSRSTSVSRDAAAKSRNATEAPAAASSARPARAARFCGILVVLPADEPQTVAIADVHCHCPYAENATDSSTAPYSDAQLVDGGNLFHICPLQGGHSDLAAVEPILPAVHDPALLRDESSRDCRSHYDPAYDALVFGEVDGLPSSNQAAARTNWTLAAKPCTLGWSDYAELMDEALVTGPTAESTSSVRSSRLLLDFAASTLRQAGLMLQSAADEMQQVARPAVGTHIAGEQPTSPR